MVKQVRVSVCSLLLRFDWDNYEAELARDDCWLFVLKLKFISSGSILSRLTDWLIPISWFQVWASDRYKLHRESLTTLRFTPNQFGSISTYDDVSMCHQSKPLVVYYKFLKWACPLSLTHVPSILFTEYCYYRILSSIQYNNQNNNRLEYQFYLRQTP